MCNALECVVRDTSRMCVLQVFVLEVSDMELSCLRFAGSADVADDAPAINLMHFESSI